MTIATTTLGTTKVVENQSATDSIPWGGVLLNDGSGVAVLWADYQTASIHLTMLGHGGTVGSTVSLALGSDIGRTVAADSDFSISAAGTNRFVVVADDGDEGNPPFTNAYMRVYDSSGAPVTSTIDIGTYRYYNVTGVADGSFIVTWYNDAAQRYFYTHYNKDGVGIANQTNKQFAAPTNVVLLSVAGDSSGGFMYSTPATGNSPDGSQIKYVNAAGAETLALTVAAGYEGTLAYDGANFWFFYSGAGDVVSAAKISGTTHTLLNTYTYTGFTSASTPIVNALPNGHFLIADYALGTGSSSTFVEVDNAGTVLEKYSIPAGDFALVVPTTDSGGLILLNYDSGNTMFDLSATEAFGSTYLDPLPATITPESISISDTSANDSLGNSAVATLTVSSGTTITGYGIQGGTAGTYVIGGVTYTLSKAGTYGTLYLDASAGANGKHVYVPDSTAINALSANATDTFTVTAHNAATTDGTATFTVNITGVNDLPVVANLNGFAGQFKATLSNTSTDNIAPATVSATDVDSANLAGGYLQINLAGGTNDGYFVADVNKIKGGADGRLSAGEAVFVDLGGTGTSYVQIGTVAATGGVLHIDFNAGTTAAQVTWLLKNLTYTAPSTGLRSFTLVLNDGDGGTSSTSAFTMNGTDGTPPTLNSGTPADDATGVATTVSPQVVFSEAVKFGAGSVYLVDVSANSVVEQFDVGTAQGTGDGKVSISGSTLTINPTASLDFAKAYAIKIDSGAVTDIAGNAYAGISNTTTLNFTTISDPPTVTISAAPTSLTAGQHATITFTFSKTPTGFAAVDIAVTGGSLTGLTVDPGNDKVYTADFSPSAAQSLNASISVAANSFTDATSQNNLASNVLSITGDTLAPTVASIERSAPAGALTNADSLTFLVTFSEAVGANLDAADFTVTGTTATVTTVTPAGGNAYLVTVTGGDLASLNGAVSLGISGSNNLVDAVGNALASTTPTGVLQGYTVDNTVGAPTFALHADTGASNSDGLTNDSTINVTLAGDVASWEYSTDGGANWTAGTGTGFTLADGSYVAGAVHVRQTDTAGNVSAAASTAGAITIDTAAAAPGLQLHADTGASASDGITKDGTVDATLPGDAASWEYSVDSGATWNAGSGAAFSLAQGSYATGTVKLRYTDLAGNVSAVKSSVAAVTVDHAAAAPAFALAFDTGASGSDGLTKSGAVNVTLATDAASWEFSTDGGAHWSTGTGASFTLAQGSHAVGSVQVRQTDVAGNLGTAASNAAAITVDTTANAPALALATDSGASATDGITSDGSVDVTLPGDTASWEYSVDGGSHWTAGSGTSFSLAAGAYASGAVQARYTDNAGNLSAAGSNGASISVDTTAAAPSFGLALDTGTSGSDGITRNASVNVTLPGDADTWEYSVDGGAHWTAGSGASFDLVSGAHAAGDVKLRYTDLAGNPSGAAANPGSITIDTTVAAPALALAGDTGDSGSDGTTSNTSVNVTLAADVASWEYSSDAGAHWTTGTGTSFTLAAGSYGAGAVQVRQADIAGNLSAAASNGAAITIDTSAAAPALALAVDTGASASDGITSDGTVNATLPADSASWEYSVDGGAHWAAGSGSSFTLGAGSHAGGSVQVRYTDHAGNHSAAAGIAATIVVVTSPPAPALALAADTGSSNSDGVTSNPQVDVTLAVDAAGWAYSVDGGSHWTAGSGSSFTLADGAYAAGVVLVRQTDIAGNTSSAGSNRGAITIDTGASAPALALAADTGASASDGITMDGTVNVTLPGDTASWELSVDGGAHWSPGSGATFTLAEGSHAAGAVAVRYTDNAGNLSAPASNPAPIRVDHTVAAPALALAADTGASASDGVTSNGSVNVTLAVDVASWEYSVDGGAHWTAGDGAAFGLADGIYAAGALQVRQADIAGNASAAASKAAPVTIDSAAAAPAFALAADTGASAGDGISANGAVGVTLPLDAASWEYSVDAGAHWSAGSGAAFTLAEASYASGAVRVRYTDNAGNLSAAASNAAALSIDHTAAAPALALAADTGASSSDGITSNATVKVALAPDAARWEYSVDAGAHWTAGSGASFTLADGSHAAGTVQVRQTDLAGNLSVAGANAAAITVDTAAAAPALALAVDTGLHANDGITTDGRFKVTLAADAASWEYSVDAGAHWTAGSGASFLVADGSYDHGAVQARYTDKAGNLSAVASGPDILHIDNTAPAPALALAQDTGANSTDGVTVNPAVKASLPADVASWEYSTDAGAHWSVGAGATFDLAVGAHAAGSVQVRYTDLAGNHSVAASNAGAYAIEQVVVPPPVTIPVDGVPVQGSTVTNSDGSTSAVLVVPVVLPTRVDDTGDAAVANIPLAAAGDGAAPALSVAVPVGYGLQVTGSPGVQLPAAGLGELIREITAHTAGGSSDQAGLIGNGSAFLSALPQNAPVLVKSITPSIADGAPASAPVVISAPPAAPGSALTALVIDSTHLPAGTTIELENVDFAAVIGALRVTGGDGRQTVFGDGAAQFIYLGADDDVLHGGAGNDIVGSAGGNDQVYGDEGNDIVFGGIGNDYLDGGSGTDTVLMQGASRADYSFRFDHGNLVATQLHGGPDGVDTIANVEILRFAGAKADMGVEASLRRVYDTLFDRPADRAGTAYWTAASAHGVSLHDIGAALLSSAEAAGLAAMASNAAFVDQLYRDALGAQPLQQASPAERADWIALLDQHKADRADVLVGIANSANKLALDAGEQSDLAFSDTDAATLVRLYATVFGRHGDEAGLNYWIGRSEAGMAMRDIAAAFMQSGEAAQHYGGTSDDQFVQALYGVGLGRQASATEIGFWSDKLHAGALSRADLVLYFTDSPEQVLLVGHSTSMPTL